ncbi:MucR family transcriptional regulator [Methylobacterium sp. V23]|uniref:MucR family transcriptional regulator n=1 Tax=Methylobacterium sp. V23 TaxID=2044878 RepID=UPI000CDA50F6|nr:MucR family transcriptional regulator [Methylobacterium sp. V23]POR42669.1 MucR family transcriptional regulator [Methylobacterium sp. V23]
MNDSTPGPATNYIEITADIVSAYVSKNSVPPTELGELISSVHQALSGLKSPVVPAAEEVEKPTAAQIKKSITPDALISFEDGKHYKTLKRHLTLHGLTPKTYRAKYGLSPEYPMTAPSYSAQRAELARSIGLGQRRKDQAKAKAAVVDETVSAAPAGAKPKKAGRPRKAAASE